MRRFLCPAILALSIGGSFTAGVACAGGQQAPPSATAARPGDGESIALVHLINQHEIELAQLALTRPASQTTQALAAMLQREHTQNEGEQAALGIGGEHTPAVVSLERRMQAESLKLKRLPPDAFEAAYIDAMVQGHLAALKLLDARAPLAQSAEVRQYLLQTRTAVDSHLSQARKLQTGAVGK